ncbi:MAG: hypothetical protein ABIJ03_04435 [Patescibacteria group bacterium]|nr:hypothetical protein [Patescibacteria group bacterium]
MTLLLIGVFVFIMIGLYRGYQEAVNKKRYLVLTGIGLLVPILALFLFGPLLLISPLKPGFAQINRGDNITIFYPASNKQIPLKRTADGKHQEAKLISQQEASQMALLYTQKAVDKNEEFYQVPVNAKVLLVLGETDLFRYGGVMQGGGTGNEYGIVIDEVFLNEKLIAHELSHDVIRNLLGPINSFKLPTWFDEGMATYIAGQNEYLSEGEAKDMLVQGAYVRDLSRWEGFFGHLRWKFTDIREPRKTYGQAYLFIKYLFDTYGENKMYQLIVAMKSASFKRAFEQTLGVTSKMANEQFISSLVE